jgi:hypothetical protein
MTARELPPGTFEEISGGGARKFESGERKHNGPAAPAAILDPRDPMQAARALVAARFVNDGHRLLHRHRGTNWSFETNHYALADQETVRTEVWKFLEQAQRRGNNGKPVPFKPNRARVSDVLDALASVCNLDSRIDPPAWLDGADDLPAAAEMLALGNGLLQRRRITSVSLRARSRTPRTRPTRSTGWRSSATYSEPMRAPSPPCRIGSAMLCRPTPRNRKSCSSSARDARARAPSRACSPRSSAATVSPTRRSPACKRRSGSLR